MSIVITISVDSFTEAANIFARLAGESTTPSVTVAEKQAPKATAAPMATPTAAPTPAPTPAPETLKATAAPTPAPTQAPTPEAKASGPVPYEKSGVPEMIQKVAAGKGRDAAVALLKEFGAGRGPELKPEQFDAFKARAEEVLKA